MDENKIAPVLLAVVAVFALVGMIMMYTNSTTGMYTYAGQHVQFKPAEACKSIGCELLGTENYLPEIGKSAAICQCDSQTYAVPLVQQVPYPPEYYPVTVGQTVVPESPAYPYPQKIVKVQK